MMLRAVLIAFLLSSMLSACTTREAHERTTKHGVLTIALRKEPISLNPLALEGTDSYTFGPLMFS